MRILAAVLVLGFSTSAPAESELDRKLDECAKLASASVDVHGSVSAVEQAIATAKQEKINGCAEANKALAKNEAFVKRLIVASGQAGGALTAAVDHVDVLISDQLTKVGGELSVVRAIPDSPSDRSNKTIRAIEKAQAAATEQYLAYNKDWDKMFAPKPNSPISVIVSADGESAAGH